MDQTLQLQLLVSLGIIVQQEQNIQLNTHVQKVHITLEQVKLVLVNVLHVQLAIIVIRKDLQRILRKYLLDTTQQ